MNLFKIAVGLYAVLVMCGVYDWAKFIRGSRNATYEQTVDKTI